MAISSMGFGAGASPADRAHKQREDTRRSMIPALLVAAALCLLYGLSIQTRPAHIDELYHLLAGRSWAQNGNFALLDGEYLRARLFTMMVGATFGLVGDSSLLIARLPSILFMAATGAILFHWLRQQGGLIAAGVATILFGLAGYSFDIAHFARFYAPHVLLSLIAAAGMVHALPASGRIRPEGGAIAVAALALAAHLQPVTAILALALGCWLLIDQRARWVRLARSYPLGVALAAAVAVTLMILLSAELMKLAASFGHAERWALENRDDATYYLREYWRQMPLMLLLWPVAVLLSARTDARLALLSGLVVAIALLLHSFAGMKAWRYCFYAFPFFCMTYGLAAAALLPRGIERTAPRTLLLVAALFALLLVSSPVYRHGARLIVQAGRTLVANPAAIAAPVPDAGWNRAAPQLRALAMQHDTLVTGDDLRTLVHLGGYDIFISHSRLGELDPPRDFTADFRTGRPIIDSAAALSRVVACNRSGLLLVSDEHWRTPMGVPAKVADFIEARMQPIRSTADLHVFHWRQRGVTAPCPYRRPGENRQAGRKPSEGRQAGRKPHAQQLSLHPTAEAPRA